MFLKCNEAIPYSNHFTRSQRHYKLITKHKGNLGQNEGTVILFRCTVAIGTCVNIVCIHRPHDMINTTFRASLSGTFLQKGCRKPTLGVWLVTYVSMALRHGRIEVSSAWTSLDTGLKPSGPPFTLAAWSSAVSCSS